MTPSGNDERDSSPDPITLPSSPIPPHSGRKPARRTSPRKRQDISRQSSPRKTIVLEPIANQASGESPWRVRVTVEPSPEPRRSTRLLSSPAKRRRRTLVDVEEEEEGGDDAAESARPKRKRRPAREVPALSAEVSDVEPSASTQAHTSAHVVARSDGRSAFRAPGLATGPAGAGTKRRGRDRGDHTIELNKAVTENEDFSMVSLESLQSAKEASFISLHGKRQLGTIQEKLHESVGQTVASVSYMPSSPPGESNDAPATYPDIEGEAVEASKALRQSQMSFDPMSWRVTGAPKVMNVTADGFTAASETETQPRTQSQRTASPWRPSDATNIRDSHIIETIDSPYVRNNFQNEASGQSSPISEDERDRDILGLQGSQNLKGNGIDDDDIWQEEASRSVHDTQTHSDQRDPINVDDAAEPALLLENLFDQPLKPPRAKIPRTWRKSSGADFLYSDSPTRPLQQESRPSNTHGDRDAEDARASSGSAESHTPKSGRKDSANSSRILTPPSSNDLQRGTHHDQRAPAEIVVVEVNSHATTSSDAFEPDAEATRIHHDIQASPTDEASDPESEVVGEDDIDAEKERLSHETQSDANSEDDDGSEDESADDTGLFFQRDAPPVYTQSQLPYHTPLLAEQPRRRQRPPRESTANLSQLLNFAAIPSPAKLIPTPKPIGKVITKSANDSLLGRMEQRRKYGRTRPAPSAEIKIAMDPSPVNNKHSRRITPKALERQSPRKSNVGLVPIVKGDGSGSQRHAVAINRSASDLDRNAQAKFREMRDNDPEQSASEDVDEAETLHAAKRICMENRPRMEGTIPLKSLQPRVYRRGEPVSLPAPGEELSYVSASLPDTSGISTSFRSYEERLNKESPQRVRVNFNHSSSDLRLSPKKYDVPPLFQAPAQVTNTRPRIKVTENLVPNPVKRKHDALSDVSAPPGPLKRFGANLWSVLTNPRAILGARKDTEPSSKSAPPPPAHPLASPEPSLLEDDYSTLLEDSLPLDRRAALRARYGVCSSTFPWKLYHMRTLHRLHNSLFSGRRDTLVPRSGALPSSLLALLHTQQRSISGDSTYTFTPAHAYIVMAFLALLVPAHVVRGMCTGEVDFLGDGLARDLRSACAKGDEKLLRDAMTEDVWRAEGPGAWTRELEGELGVPFVVRCLADIVAEERRVAAVAREAALRIGDKGPPSR